MMVILRYMVMIITICSKMSEKLCLKRSWNDFQASVKEAFGDLRNDCDFADVTLACEDGRQIEAHRIILSASSPLMKNMLKLNKHSHPLILMRGLKYEDLLALVDFFYYGEVNISEDNLDCFLGIADELQVKGLMEQSTKNCPQRTETTITNATVSEEVKKSNTGQKQKGQGLSIAVDSEARVTLSSCGSNGFSELDETIKSMMETSPTMSNGEKSFKICKPCGKEGQSMAIRDHIEAYHLEGLALPCNNCKRTFRSRYSVEKHKCFESKINLIFFSSRTRLSLRNHKAKMHNIKRC